MSGRLFSDKHIWLLIDGNKATIGITEFAQEKLGNIMFLNLPDIGETIEVGERFGDIESIKTVSDLISPVKGKVIEINEKLIEEPELINGNAYESWFIEVEVDSVSENLMNGKLYLARKEEL